MLYRGLWEIGEYLVGALQENGSIRYYIFAKLLLQYLVLYIFYLLNLLL